MRIDTDHASIGLAGAGATHKVFTFRVCVCVCVCVCVTGMGIKGGIARKLLKEKVGRPEPPGSFDVDVLLFIDHYTVSENV